MTRDQIISIAMESGAELYADTICVNNKDADDFVMRFAHTVAAAEREECAKVCDSESSRAMWNWGNDLPTNKQFWNGGEALASSCAESIRARKD